MQYLWGELLGTANYPPIKPGEWTPCVPGAADVPGARFGEADDITPIYFGRCQHAASTQMGLRARTSSVRLCKFCKLNSIYGKFLKNKYLCQLMSAKGQLMSS